MFCIQIKAIYHPHNRMPVFASHLLAKGWHCIKQAHPVLEELLAVHQLALYLFAPCFEIHSMVQVLVHPSEWCHPGLWVDISECMNTYCNNSLLIKYCKLLRGPDKVKHTADEFLVFFCNQLIICFYYRRSVPFLLNNLHQGISKRL